MLSCPSQSLDGSTGGEAAFTLAGILAPNENGPPPGTVGVSRSRAGRESDLLVGRPGGARPVVSLDFPGQHGGPAGVFPDGLTRAPSGIFRLGHHWVCLSPVFQTMGHAIGELSLRFGSRSGGAG